MSGLQADIVDLVNKTKSLLHSTGGGQHATLGNKTVVDSDAQTWRQQAIPDYKKVYPSAGT